jgi:hypothetical protein
MYHTEALNARPFGDEDVTFSYDNYCLLKYDAKVHSYKVTWHRIPDNSNLHIHRCENPNLTVITVTP